jgi:hypothetical protein
MSKGPGIRSENTSEGRQHPLKCLQKTWNSGFLKHHNLVGKDDVPAVEVKQSLGCVEDELTIILQGSNGLGSPCDVDEVMKYCEHGGSLEDVRDGIGAAGMRRAAWVDERNSPCLTGKGSVRLCERLTATGLWRHLRQPVWFLLFQDNYEY